MSPACLCRGLSSSHARWHDDYARRDGITPPMGFSGGHLAWVLGFSWAHATCWSTPWRCQ